MFKRFNNYLLTHHPLIWNTRVVWVLAANLLLHLFFYLMGMFSFAQSDISKFYSISSMGGGTLFTLSVLCSLLTLIFWLVFYLRNNAFKSNYVIGTWHLAKETLIILLIVFTSITYFESFFCGVRAKTKSITSRETLIQEVNTVNQALAFVPQNLDDYFVLNKYGERKPEYRVSSYNVAVADSSGPYVDNEADKYVREALKRPDAYSYENYCKNEVHLDTSRFRTVLNDSLNALQNLKRIRLGKPDSIKALLVQLQKIADKYGIDQKLNLDDLASKALKPFKSFEFKPIPSSKMDYIESRQVEHPYYFERYPFSRGFSFVEEAYHPDGINSDESLTAELYITLALGILFLCYRRFSKKVFLISLVGAIVWSIFTGLVGVSAQDEKAPMWFILFLFVLFTVMSVFLVSRRSSKTLAGVCLNWHIYVLPFLALLICGLIMSYYDDRDIPYVPNVINYEEMERKYYPVYWFVKHNFLTIAKLNILFGILYVTFVFNKLAKKWHSNPEE